MSATQPLYSLPIPSAVQPYQHYYTPPQTSAFPSSLYQTPNPYTQPFIPPGLQPYASSQYWGSTVPSQQQHQQVSAWNLFQCIPKITNFSFVFLAKFLSSNHNTVPIQLQHMDIRRRHGIHRVYFSLTQSGDLVLPSSYFNWEKSQCSWIEKQHWRSFIDIYVKSELDFRSSCFITQTSYNDFEPAEIFTKFFHHRSDLIYYFIECRMLWMFLF